MLEMPLEERAAASKQQQPMGMGAFPQAQAVRNSLFSLGTTDPLTGYQRSEQGRAVAGGLQSVVGTSPLDQLIKLHERLQQQGEFCSPSVAGGCPPSRPSASSTMAKTPPAVAQPSSAAAFGALSPQSLLDPSSCSLVLSSYSAANAAQIGPQMAAAAVAASSPWHSPWSWSAAAASETTAALLNGTYGTTGGSPTGGGGWPGGYFGTAFGGLMPPNNGGSGGAGGGYFPSALGHHQTQQQQQDTEKGVALFSSQPESAPLTKLTDIGGHKMGQAKGGDTKAGLATLGATGGDSTSGGMLSSVLANVSKLAAGGAKNSRAVSAESRGQLTRKCGEGGGKMRGSRTTATGGGQSKSNNCECPNCKELLRTGVPLDKTREKHNCHIPGCHKVYSKSSHLKAHLRWHNADRPTTTKKRLFDPK